MTVYASYVSHVIHFVLNIGAAPFGNGLMALYAGNVLMVGIEPEPGVVMIELNRLPLFIGVAASTLVSFIRFELTVMLIGMAFGAQTLKTRKPLLNHPGIVRHEMALSAAG
jgi:hypothetical protein